MFNFTTITVIGRVKETKIEGPYLHFPTLKTSEVPKTHSGRKLSHHLISDDIVPSIPVAETSGRQVRIEPMNDVLWNPFEELVRFGVKGVNILLPLRFISWIEYPNKIPS